MPMSSFLESDPDVHCVERVPSYTDALTATILDHLSEQTVISLDTLIYLMPQYTWNQIFHRVDQLSRCNKVVLRRHQFEYTLFSTNFLA
jgi:hypothetical protein